jgi:DNA-binding SARP family transcriptional activator
VEFRVLGPIEVCAPDAKVRLPGLKGRMLLARLLVDAGRAVSTDALAEALWGDSVPGNVANSLQANVSKLRRAFEEQIGSAAAQATLATHGRGYVIHLDGHTLDADRVTELAAASRDALGSGSPEGAATAAAEALGLFRGDPFADVAYCDWAHSEVHRLEELRLDLTESLHAARLALGRHGEAISALEQLVAAHPFRERLIGLLMLALYRAGRQADALRCYSAARARLVDQLGIEPSAELRALEGKILAQDASLEPSMARPAPKPEAAVVGRQPERNVLADAFDRAAAGNTAVVLTFGEPGIGKSALADWLATHAGAAGAMVAHGRAPAVGGAPLYWPWTEVLRALTEQAPHAVTSLQHSDRQLLARILSGLDGGPAQPTDVTGPVVLYDAVARLLAGVGASSTVVVLLDDLHWADEATVELFGFIARARTPNRLLLAGMARPDLAKDHPLRVLLPELLTQPGVRRLDLAGLDEDEVVELMRRTTGEQPDAGVAGVVRRRTGGNPFFIREILRAAVADDGRFDPTAAGLPGTVRDVTRSRVRRLGPHAEDVFTVLSFARDAFTTVLADRLLDASAEEVLDIVERGVEAGLLSEVPGRPGLFRFAHSLVRHVFYDELTATRRAATHLRVGEVLESVAPRPEEIAAELAWHYTNAATIGGAEAAVRWERVAARRALQALAPADAVHHLRRALASVRRVLRDEALECEVLRELTAAALQAGDHDTATTADRRLVALGRPASSEAPVGGAER